MGNFSAGQAFLEDRARVVDRDHAPADDFFGKELRLPLMDHPGGDLILAPELLRGRMYITPP